MPLTVWQKEGIGGYEATLEISGVSFAYPSRSDKVVLEAIDLRLESGSSLALCGRSGCGKSTVIALLTRLYDPRQGTSRLMALISETWILRSCADIGVVSQDISLFAGTILENIAYGRPESSQEEIMAAAEAAGVLDFVHAFPNGLDEYVGEKGRSLSGGQRQRLAVARVLLKDPPIILLDEATSALDADGEFIVQQAIENLMGGRTVISVAHRLNTMHSSEHVAVLEGGRVVETGAFDKLFRSQAPSFASSRQDRHHQPRGEK